MKLSDRYEIIYYVYRTCNGATVITTQGPLTHPNGVDGDTAKRILAEYQTPAGDLDPVIELLTGERVYYRAYRIQSPSSLRSRLTLERLWQQGANNSAGDVWGLFSN